MKQTNTIKAPKWLQVELDEWLSSNDHGKCWGNVSAPQEEITRSYTFESNDCEWIVEGVASAKWTWIDDPHHEHYWQFDGLQWYTVERVNYIDFYGIEHDASLGE